MVGAKILSTIVVSETEHWQSVVLGFYFSKKEQVVKLIQENWMLGYYTWHAYLISELFICAKLLIGLS
jgi:hypothetical protein